jgi:hypothetical protein
MRRNWGHFYTDGKKHPSCTQNRAVPTQQVVEVWIMRETQVAHLLTASIQGTEWAVDVSIHSTAKDAMDRDIRWRTVPLEVRGSSFRSLGTSADQLVGMAST